MMYRVLGELSADMKHVVNSTRAIRDDQQVLRNDIKSEMRELRKETQADILEMKLRIDAVEKFNVKILAYASIAVPLIMVLMNYFMPKILHAL